TPALTELCKRFALVALIQKEARLVLASGSDAEAEPVFADDPWRRRLGRAAIERFLLLHMILGEPVKGASGKVLGEYRLDDFAEAIHPGREEFHDQRLGEAVHDQAAQSIPLGMYQPISVGNGVQPQPFSAQGDGTSQAAREEGLID